MGRMGSKEEAEQFRKLWSSSHPQKGYKLYYCWVALKGKVVFWGKSRLLRDGSFPKTSYFVPTTPCKLCLHICQCSITMLSFTKWLFPFLVCSYISYKWWVYAYCIKWWLRVDLPRRYLKPACSPEKGDFTVSGHDFNFQLQCQWFHSSLAWISNTT